MGSRSTLCGMWCKCSEIHRLVRLDSTRVDSGEFPSTITARCYTLPGFEMCDVSPLHFYNRISFVIFCIDENLIDQLVSYSVPEDRKNIIPVFVLL